MAPEESAMKRERTSSDARIRASVKYNETHVVRKFLGFNASTDADILAHLENVPNFQGYVKTLIRNDMKG